MIRKALRKLRTEPRPFRYIAGFVLWRTGLSRIFTIQVDRLRLRFFPTALSSALWYDATYCREDEAFLHAFLRPGDVAVDAGANIGFHALTAALAVGPTGHVVAIEAHPQTFDFLRRNVALNAGLPVEPLHIALGDRDGTVTFSDKVLDDQNEVVPAGGRGVQVPTRPLDKVLGNRFSRIRLLKIDVEGYEKFVLDGAVETLKKTDAVHFEAWETHARKHGYSSPDLAAMLRRAGFQVFRVSGTDLSEIPPGYVSAKCENLLAVRDAPALLGPGRFRLRP